MSKLVSEKRQEVELRGGIGQGECSIIGILAS